MFFVGCCDRLLIFLCELCVVVLCCVCFLLWVCWLSCLVGVMCLFVCVFFFFFLFVVSLVVCVVVLFVCWLLRLVVVLLVCASVCVLVCAFCVDGLLVVVLGCYFDYVSVRSLFAVVVVCVFCGMLLVRWWLWLAAVLILCELNRVCVVFVCVFAFC